MNWASHNARRCLPTPLGPANSIACGSRRELWAPASLVLTPSCPIKGGKGMAQSSLGVGAPRHYLTQLFEGQACTITIADLREHKQNCDKYLYAKVSAHSRDSADFIAFFGRYSGPGMDLVRASRFKRGSTSRPSILGAAHEDLIGEGRSASSGLSSTRRISTASRISSLRHWFRQPVE